MMAELHMGQYVAILGISLYVVGFGLGPLVWGPLSEVSFILALLHMATHQRF
jgi:DHA1 family multidrug resistance protein-like MFS transporter